jgi:hypothetical protein
MIELSQEFERHQFWTSNSDVELTRRWINDLQMIGYQFPSIDDQMIDDSFPNCRKANYRSMSAAISTRTQLAERYIIELGEWCSINDTFQFMSPNLKLINIINRFNRTALIITSNYRFISSIGILQRLYAPYFGAIIFCGPVYSAIIYQRRAHRYPSIDNTFSYIHVNENEIKDGYFAYFCVLKVIELRLQSIDGYIVMADDTVYNFWNHIELSRFRLNGVNRNQNNTWWTSRYGQLAITRVLQQIDNGSIDESCWKTYESNVGGNGRRLLNESDVWGVSDWYYLPNNDNATLFYALATLFYESGVFHEIAIPKIGAALNWLHIYNSDQL